LNKVIRGVAGLVFQDPTTQRCWALTAAHVLAPTEFSGGEAIALSHPPASDIPAVEPFIAGFLRGPASFHAMVNIDAGICAVNADSIDAGPLKTATGLTLANTGQFDSGSTYEAKLPSGTYQTVLSGNDTVAQVYDLEGTQAYVTNLEALDIPAVPGDSGSLVYRRQGNGTAEAVGIVVGATQPPGKAFAHPVSAILDRFADAHRPLTLPF
jgi:hypothetical protein